MAWLSRFAQPACRLACLVAASVATAACTLLQDLDGLHGGHAASTSGAGNTSGGGDAGSGGGGGSSGTSAGGSGGGGGGAGGGGCGPLLPPVAPCGGFVQTFDSQAELEAEWIYVTGDQDAVVVDGALEVRLMAGEPNAYVEVNHDLTIEDCAVWVEILAISTEDDVTTRLSLGENGEASIYSLGVLNGRLEARADNSNVVASVDYDEQSMHHVRMRESGGDLHYDYSDDGVCWTELHALRDPSLPPLRPRLVVSNVPPTPGVESFGVFDNLGVTR